jgi:hypothetical protein
MGKYFKKVAISKKMKKRIIRETAITGAAIGTTVGTMALIRAFAKSKKSQLTHN